MKLYSNTNEDTDLTRTGNISSLESGYLQTRGSQVATRTGTRKPAERNYISQRYILTPFEQRLILEDDRFYRQLQLQREKDDLARRQMIQRNLYNTLGTTATTAGKQLIHSYLY